jgi:hypothetical protein
MRKEAIEREERHHHENADTGPRHPFARAGRRSKIGHIRHRGLRIARDNTFKGAERARADSLATTPRLPDTESFKRTPYLTTVRGVADLTKTLQNKQTRFFKDGLERPCHILWRKIATHSLEGRGEKRHGHREGAEVRANPPHLGLRIVSTRETIFGEASKL